MNLIVHYYFFELTLFSKKKKLHEGALLKCFCNSSTPDHSLLILLSLVGN